MLRLMTNRAFGPAGICNPKHLFSVRCFASSKKPTSPKAVAIGGGVTRTLIKKAKAYSRMSEMEADKRLGLQISTFETRAIPVSEMLAGAKPENDGLEDAQLKRVKEKVFDNIVDFVELEGYPAGIKDFKEANVNDLVLLIIFPIIIAVRRQTGRDLRLYREREIVATDLASGGYREFVVMDYIGIGDRKFVFVVEAKRSSVARAKKQCLLAMKEMGDNNRGGVIYGFLTTGDQWTMISYDGKVFTPTRHFYSLFHTMKDNKEEWMETSSIIVDCIHTALKSGGFVAE